MNTTIKSREIIQCTDNDRLILIIREYGDIVGINYMQGNEVEHFEEFYNTPDVRLTIYYNTVAPYLGGVSEIDRVNQAIWAYFDYCNSIDELNN